MTAAVYAKDLLQRVVVQQVHHEMRMRDIVLGIQEEMTYVARHQRDADYEQLLDWLSHTDYAPKQNEILREKQRGTCLWLFDTREFQHWEKTPGQVLHGFGIPGAGKTFAASSVINFLQQKYLSHSGIGIAYVYCDFRRQQEQKADNILANILKQLLHSRPDLAHVVKVFHQRHYKARSKPILSEVATMLHTVVQSFERVFIVIDALDELNGSQYELLRELVPLQETYSANILMTARKDVFYVEKWFKKVESLEIAAVERDIRSYLDSNACRIPAHILSTSGLAEEVKSTIITAAKGMFLLARLAFEDLISKGSVKDVKAALKNLPSGSSAYNEAYRIAIRRISQHHRHLAKRIFTWLTLAKRPINVLELQHALAIQTGENPLDPETWQNSSDFPNICCGLITIERETNIIRLVHFTVQHYFENTLIPERQVLEYGVAIACVRYLSLDTFAAGRCASDCQGLVEFRDRLSKYKFYDYAAKNWGYHLQEARSACQEVFSLLLSFPKCDASSQSLLLEHNVDDERHDRCDWDGSRRVNGLHLAAYFGLDSIVGYLLPQFDINTPCEIGRTALSYAALNGYAGVVQLLLDRGAEIDFRDMRGQTPLSLAAENGREQVVNLLIRRGANIDSISDDVCADYQTPLSYAAARGDERMVNLLLHYNANVDLQSLQEATALILAAENGYDGIVRLLLQQNADIDLQDYRDKTALARAASNGHESIVQLLLSYGADVDFLDDEGKSALDLAASNGHIDVVKLFFHHEDDICQQDIVTLAYAVRNRREEVVKFLIKHIIGI
ncbi:hypothetical protein QQS21_002869 [Conoideocrella luteorostrata]|uniref:Ankyrin n=1 Tax=Conoideocrella luteorostrata TaxID=1105319 RepID=A0AAJ0CUH6_9HYPO|nr:hypothetical protein QQS21_002869 [Conoideocrella luteorostrata]